MDSNTRSIVLSLYLPTMILSFATGMLTLIMPLYARSFDISYGMVGLVLAAQGIGNLLGDVPAGIMLNHLGHKRAMLIGVGLYGLAMLAMAWAQSVSHLIIFGLIAGFGNAMWNISRHAYMTDLIPLERRGRATATFGGLNRIGSFAGPFIGGLIAAAYGLRVPYVIFAVVTLIALILSAIFVNEEVSVRNHRGGMRGHLRHVVHVVRTYATIFSTAGVAQLLAQMVRTGRNTVIPLYGADILGLNVQSIGLIVTLAAAVDMSMFYPAGVLMDRYGRKYASVPSFFIQGVGMALVPFAAGFWGLLGATVVIGFGNGIGSGTMLTLGSDLAPKDSIGEFLGVWRLVGDVGQTGGPIAVGGVADLVGLAMSPIVLALVGFGAAAILAWGVPETLVRDPVVAPAET